MQVTRSGDKEIPPYLYYKTKPYKAGTNRKFEVKSKDMEDFTIFYKSSHNESLLSKEVWHQGKIFYGDNHKLDDENEFFQFLIIAKPVSDKARISSIKFGN